MLASGCKHTGHFKCDCGHFRKETWTLFEKERKSKRGGDGRRDKMRIKIRLSLTGCREFIVQVTCKMDAELAID